MEPVGVIGGELVAQHLGRDQRNLEPSGYPPVLSLVIPTLNEAANILPLLSRIYQAVGDIPTEIIFVDDSSDVTPKVIRTAAKDAPTKIVLVRRAPEHRQGGLGGAVMGGVARARGEWVCVMDADLQHPPELLRQLLTKGQNSNCDIVIASRYVPGGSAEGLGAAIRKGISHASRWLARLLFVERLWSITDPCAGYFLVRRSLLRRAELRPSGFKILLEILMRTDWEHVSEIPYRFEGRAGGQSKATLAQGFAFLRHVLKLWLEVPGAGRFWKFALVGASGVVVNMALLWLLAVVAEAYHWTAWAIAVEGSIIWNYLLNRNLTWADRLGKGRFWKEFGAYQGVACVALFANAAMFALMIEGLRLHVLSAGLVGTLGGILINFVGADRLVFGRFFARSKLGAKRKEALSAEAE